MSAVVSPTARVIETAGDWKGSLQLLMRDFRFQAGLTNQLDALGPQPFTGDAIKDIVLWKVNRYVKLSEGALAALNGVAEFQPKSHRGAEILLTTLLQEAGVDLPMASTFLRFRNRKVFQIIDRHAYRALYGERYPLHSSSTTELKVSLYFRFLDDLVLLAESKDVAFEDLDRVLYVFDKQVNGKL